VRITRKQVANILIAQSQEYRAGLGVLSNWVFLSLCVGGCSLYPHGRIVVLFW